MSLGYPPREIPARRAFIDPPAICIYCLGVEVHNEDEGEFGDTGPICNDCLDELEDEL